MTRTWSECGCGEDVLPRPYRKMRLSVAWAALYSGLVQYMRNVAMWVLCVNCGNGLRASGGQATPDRELESLRHWVALM